MDRQKVASSQVGATVSQQVAARLREAMTNAAINTQAVLSARSGVPQPTIARVLQGAGSRGPEMGTLVRLAEACRVTARWLIAGEDEGAEPMPNYVDNFGDLSDDEVMLIKAFRRANLTGKSLVMHTAVVVSKVVDDGAS